jgi:hypothetical protein
MIDRLTDKEQNLGWKFELLESSGGQQSDFVSRLRYLDVLKVRGCLLPERAILEGEHGTLSEASAHKEFSLVVMDLNHQYATSVVNTVLDFIVLVNLGPEYVGSIYLDPSSIRSEDFDYLQSIFLELLKKDQTPGVDIANLSERIGIPYDKLKEAESSDTGEEGEKTEKKEEKEGIEPKKEGTANE